MTLLKKLQAHRGGLIQIKTQLCWLDRGWDKNPDRICLILDAAAATPSAAPSTPGVARVSAGGTVAALLLVDGAPHWIWVTAEDIELLDGDHQ